MCRSVWNVTGLLIPASVTHFFNNIVHIAAAGDHRQHLFVLADAAVDPARTALLHRVGKGGFKLGGGGGAVALGTKALGQLYKIRPALRLFSPLLRGYPQPSSIRSRRLRAIPSMIRR